MNQLPASPIQSQLRKIYFLTQILGAKVFWQNGTIGSLTDVIVVDRDKLAEVTHFLVSRPFGRPSLLIPLEKIQTMNAKEVRVELESLESYQTEPKADMILLKDFILDKKVLDVEDREVEVVYDVKMTRINDRLYVTDVDLSKYSLLRRMGLKWLADLIYRPKYKPNQEIIPWAYVQPLPADIGRFKGEVKLNILKERLHDIDPVDLADILEELDPGQRATIFGELDTSHASDTLEEIDPNVQRELVASLKRDRVAQLINEMTPAQAADVLSALPANHAEEIITLLADNKIKIKKIKSIMQKQEAKIMDFAIADFIQFGPRTTVGQVEEEFPKTTRGKNFLTYIYVTDETGKLLGIADLKELLMADDSVFLKDIMDTNVISLSPDNTLKETSRMFKRYNFQALPITDGEDKILGVIPYRDIMRLRHKMV